jgi:hypothetical protein
VKRAALAAAGIAIAGLLAAASAPAETFRCGNWLVDERQTPEQIREKCGAPTSTSTKTEDVYGPSDAGTGGWIKRGTTTTETWIYDRGNNAAPMVVTIVDGKVRSIERAKR